MKPSILYCTLVWLSGVAGSPRALAEVGTVLVPPGLENTEGSGSFASHDPPGSGFRSQDLYLADEFSSLPDGRGVLDGLAWRPDRTVRHPRVTFCSDSEIRLSTTEAEPASGLSRTLGRNVGGDETLVYSGDLRLETDGAGPSSGPREFDYVVDFQKPFLYDSSQGNLLVDWSCGPGSRGAPLFDAVTTRESRRMVWAWSPSASSAADWRDAARVVQFQFLPDSPLQAGDADQDLDFDQFDLVQVQQAAKYMTGAPATWGEGDWDGAPGGFPQHPPEGDGVFDQFDIIAAQLGATYKTGSYAAIQADGTMDGGQRSSLGFGNVIPTELGADFLLDELAVVGPLAGGGDVGNVAVVSIPEPSTVVLSFLGFVFGVGYFRRKPSKG